MICDICEDDDGTKANFKCKFCGKDVCDNCVYRWDILDFLFKKKECCCRDCGDKLEPKLTKLYLKKILIKAGVKDIMLRDIKNILMLEEIEEK